MRRVSRVRFWPGPAGGGARALELEGSVDGAAWGRLGPLQWAGPLYWTGAELLRNGKDV